MTLVDPEGAGRRESVYNNKSDGAFLTVPMETVLVDGSNRHSPVDWKVLLDGRPREGWKKGECIQQ